MCKIHDNIIYSKLPKLVLQGKPGFMIKVIFVLPVMCSISTKYECITITNDEINSYKWIFILVYWLMGVLDIYTMVHTTIRYIKTVFKLQMILCIFKSVSGATKVTKRKKSIRFLCCCHIIHLFLSFSAPYFRTSSMGDKNAYFL